MVVVTEVEPRTMGSIIAAGVDRKCSYSRQIVVYSGMKRLRPIHPQLAAVVVDPSIRMLAVATVEAATIVVAEAGLRPSERGNSLHCTIGTLARPNTHS